MEVSKVLIVRKFPLSFAEEVIVWISPCVLAVGLRSSSCLLARALNLRYLKFGLRYNPVSLFVLTGGTHAIISFESIATISLLSDLSSYYIVFLFGLSLFYENLLHSEPSGSNILFLFMSISAYLCLFSLYFFLNYFSL